MNRKTVSAVALMLLAATMWGFSRFFSREIMGACFSPYEIAAVRTLMAVVILFFILLVLDRDALRINRHDIPCSYSSDKLLTDLALFVSQESVNLSASTVQMTSPVYVVIIMTLLFSSKTTG